jgi:hypothetical protein
MQCLAPPIYIYVPSYTSYICILICLVSNSYSHMLCMLMLMLMLIILCLLLWEANPAVLPGAVHIMLQLPCGRRLFLTTESSSCHASTTLRHYREPFMSFFVMHMRPTLWHYREPFISCFSYPAVGDLSSLPRAFHVMLQLPYGITGDRHT